MAGTRSHATDVRDSIEAKVAKDKDVEMRDRPELDGDDEDEDAEDDDLEQDADGDSDAEAEEDADGEPDETGEDGDADDWLSQIDRLQSFLCSYEKDGQELAAGFQRIPNKRVLPDYFTIIDTPIAFSTIRGKLNKKLYLNFREFVRDVAQICHNAQVYNRPSAPIFGAAEDLRQVFKAELGRLADKGLIRPDEAELPNLGELPPAEDSVDEDEDGGEEDDVDEEEEDEESEEEEEEEEEESTRSRGRLRARAAASHRATGGGEDDEHKKRGRPPTLLTPTEARITAMLKGLRKMQDDEGNPLVADFDKLPDKTMFPDYYEIIENPIALDTIKKKMKRKKYANVDDALRDLNLMFENAQTYNEDDSDIFDAAVKLQKQARVLAAQQRARPDDDFRDEEGKLPLSEVQHNDETYKIGDWVHIRNANDPAKPIVSQIFRIWQDRAGQRWLNACWYYRPEQTVHRFDKLFFDHEVAKTSQYRDHPIEDLLDKCFVMFVTRFPRGRPRGFPRDKAVYLCESRYNEDRCRFAKIKTWSSCVPDEVRDQDYEMDLFEQPLRLKKVPGPIKHLLQPDAKESDPLPKPTWGKPNAPPIVGAVHRRPRESNETPPPEPTPAPQTRPYQSFDASRRASFNPPGSHATRGSMTMNPPHQQQTPYHQTGAPVPSPSPVPYAQPYQTQQQQQPAYPQQPQQYHSPNPYASASPVAHHQVPHHPQSPASMQHSTMRPGMYPSQQPAQGYGSQQPSYQGPSYQQHQQPGYPQSPAGVPPRHPQIHPQMPNHTAAAAPHSFDYNHQQHYQYQRGQSSFIPGRNNFAPGYHNSPAMPQAHQSPAPQQPQSQMASANAYNNAPRAPEVYTLPPELSDQVPEHIRKHFHCDDSGNLIFYDKPPVERANKDGLSHESHGLDHSAAYTNRILAAKAARIQKRKERDAARAKEDRQRRDAEPQPPGRTGSSSGGSLEDDKFFRGMMVWAAGHMWQTKRDYPWLFADEDGEEAKGQQPEKRGENGVDGQQGREDVDHPMAELQPQTQTA